MYTKEGITTASNAFVRKLMDAGVGCICFDGVDQPSIVVDMFVISCPDSTFQLEIFNFRSPQRQETALFSKHDIKRLLLRPKRKE